MNKIKKQTKTVNKKDKMEIDLFTKSLAKLLLEQVGLINNEIEDKGHNNRL